jgi:hypothetical protein
MIHLTDMRLVTHQARAGPPSRLQVLRVVSPKSKFEGRIMVKGGGGGDEEGTRRGRGKPLLKV